jgi:hypothetical protein
MTNSLEPPYTFDKLRAATEKEVIAGINDQLEKLKKKLLIGGSDKAVYGLNAQFQIQELARRVQERREEVQDRQARIMIVCTILITVMTLVIALR